MLKEIAKDAATVVAVLVCTVAAFAVQRGLPPAPLAVPLLMVTDSPAAPVGPAALERPTPSARRASPRPPSARTPAGPTPGRSGASTSGSTAGRSRTRRWPPTLPGSTTRAGRRRARRRRRWARRASGPASPAVRARPGNGRPGSSPATGGPPADRGRGQARPFGAADLAAVLAICYQPRRRGRGRESEKVALGARPPRRRDLVDYAAGTARLVGNAGTSPRERDPGPANSAARVR